MYKTENSELLQKVYKNYEDHFMVQNNIKELLTFVEMKSLIADREFLHTIRLTDALPLYARILFLESINALCVESGNKNETLQRFVLQMIVELETTAKFKASLQSKFLTDWLRLELLPSSMLDEDTLYRMCNDTQLDQYNAVKALRILKERKKQ